MKLPCKVIEDMLPMYYDKVCSEESVALIDEHLKDCPHCNYIFSELRSSIEIPENPVDDMKPLKRIQKTYRKMKMYWLIAVFAILLLIPVAFLAGNEQGEQREQAVKFSEDEAITYANSFMNCLADGDYAKAFSSFDIEEKKRQWLRDWFEEDDLINFEADGLKKFCEMGEKLEELGGIVSYAFVGIYDNGYDNYGNKEYQVAYTVEFEGKDESFSVFLSERGVSHIGAADGYLKHPLVQFCIWGEWLWQDYQRCYYDFDLKQYVYYDEEEK